jgi:hypothetical protein
VLAERSGGWLALADAALAPTIALTGGRALPAWPDLSAWLASLLGYDANGGPPLSRATLAQLRRIAELEAAVAQREAQVVDLEARARWLEAQAGEARRALEAVERGRLLRLLRWLGRRGP